MRSKILYTAGSIIALLVMLTILFSIHPKGFLRRNDGKFYGTGYVSRFQTRKARQEGGTSCLALSNPFRTFRREGHGVGQRKRAKINPAKKLKK